jgi:hypothetical protein
MCSTNSVAPKLFLSNSSKPMRPLLGSPAAASARRDSASFPEGTGHGAAIVQEPVLHRGFLQLLHYRGGVFRRHAGVQRMEVAFVPRLGPKWSLAYCTSPNPRGDPQRRQRWRCSRRRRQWLSRMKCPPPSRRRGFPFLWSGPKSFVVWHRTALAFEAPRNLDVEQFSYSEPFIFLLFMQHAAGNPVGRGNSYICIFMTS